MEKIRNNHFPFHPRNFAQISRDLPPEDIFGSIHPARHYDITRPLTEWSCVKFFFYNKARLFYSYNANHDITPRAGAQFAIFCNATERDEIQSRDERRKSLIDTRSIER